MSWWRSGPGLRGVRWSSLALVAVCGLVALVCLAAAARGRTLALAPAAVAVALALREARRGRHTRRSR